MALSARQNELRAFDLVQVAPTLGRALNLADHATQHARDAGEPDVTVREFYADLAALKASLLAEIQSAAEGMNFTPGQASAEAMAVGRFLGVVPT